MKTRTAIIVSTLLSTPCAVAQQDDVTFFVIGKHANYSQTAAGELEPVDFSFFSEIFLTSSGDADDASLRFPTGEVIDYKDMRKAYGGDRDNLLLVSGEDRYTTFADLQRRYPDGDYTVSFATPSGSVDEGILTFQERPLPDAPVIALRQGDGDDCAILAPGQDVTVAWQPFADGRADPNDILDDLVFVILTDADGIRVAHSGRPFEGRPYLTYADPSHVISGDALKPDSRYTLSVEHALLDDTTRFDGVPAFTTRAVTTKREIRTGSTEMTECLAPAPMLSSSVTMLYYKDIGPAARFYGDTLGLELELDWDWIRFYKTGPASSVGLVTEGDGAWHEVRERNAVMLSLVTEDVDAWYRRIADRDGVVILKDIGDGGPIRSFLIEDPGGYTVEFFEWLAKPE
jgi:predicted enzyme related to lactoylglutathione lyase